METDSDCFECLVCGYIYDPEAGDPVGGIPSGVKFFSLPDDWLCPECSAGKDEFALVELWPWLPSIRKIILCDPVDISNPSE
jgi:rubredoxin